LRSRLEISGSVSDPEGETLEMPAPDELTQFFATVTHNQKANIAAFPNWYRLVRRVNDCFQRAGANLENPSPLMSAILMLRCQYAYKAAAGMAFSGQVVETFPMLRFCLECAGYAIVIFRDPELQTVYMSRHVDEAGMEAQKRKFTIGELRKSIMAVNQAVGATFDGLYQRTIDFGGHPNPHAMMSAIEMGQASGGFSALALSTDHQVLQHAMKSTAQAGLCALLIFQHVFRSTFKSLGVTADIDALIGEGVL
jgi:hypothetical protein